MFRLYYDYDNSYKKKQFVGNVTFAITIFSLILLGILFLCSDQVSLIFEDIPFTPYYAYAIGTSFCMTFAFVPLTLFQVEENAISFFVFSLSSLLINTGFILFYLLIMDQGAIGLIKGKFYGSIFMFPICLIITIKSSVFNINRQILRSILTFSLPMVPVLLSTWILNMSNRIFIEQYFSMEEVGVFSLAFKK